MHTINSYNAKYMKRVLTILPLTALCISTMQAQHKNEYTNFADTTFNIQEVVATAARTNHEVGRTYEISSYFN